MGSAYVLAAVVVLGLLGALGAGIKGYSLGRSSRESEVIELRASIAAAEKLVEAERTRLDSAAKKAAAGYRAQVEKLRLEAENRPQLIKVIRDEATCDLPPAFRVLHDAAAGYATAEGSGGSAAAADVAQTIALNYQLCRENAARQQALIDVVKEVVREEGKEGQR